MLYELRKRLGLGAVGARKSTILHSTEDEYPKAPIETLDTLLRDARDLVGSWGGEFVFVYLPAWNRLCPAISGLEDYCDKIPHDYRRDEILLAAKEAGVLVLDMTEPMTDMARSGEEIYFYTGSHYNQRD